MKMKTGHRVTKDMRVLGGLAQIWKKGGLTGEIKVRMFESICVPTVCTGVRHGL